MFNCTATIFLNEDFNECLNGSTKGPPPPQKKILGLFPLKAYKLNGKILQGKDCLLAF